MGKSGTFKKLAVGAAIAGAAGYVVGVLTAPSEGKKTRQRLKKSTDTSVSQVEQQLKELHNELGDLVNDKKDSSQELSGRMQKKFAAAVDNARDTKNKLREVLSAVHEGEASDKDLDRALEDARRALEHLRLFIKK